MPLDPRLWGTLGICNFGNCGNTEGSFLAHFSSLKGGSFWLKQLSLTMQPESEEEVLLEPEAPAQAPANSGDAGSPEWSGESQLPEEYPVDAALFESGEPSPLKLRKIQSSRCSGFTDAASSEEAELRLKRRAVRANKSLEHAFYICKRG